MRTLALDEPQRTAGSLSNTVYFLGSAPDWIGGGRVVSDLVKIAAPPCSPYIGHNNTEAAEAPSGAEILSW